LDEGSATIAQQVLVRPRSHADLPRLYVRQTTKSRRQRRVMFGPEAAAALRRWKAEQASERLAFAGAWKVHGGLGVEAPWAVTEADGSVIHPGTLLARWKVLVKAAGVTPIGLHGARHTHAELALEAGVRPDVLSRSLGHASIGTTLNVYTHDNDEQAAEAAAKVAAIMDG
jgi:integrase